MTRPLVLVSNDDGYRALGIRSIAEALSREFDVVVCAPDNEQSASSHSLSLNRPLRVIEHEKGIFSVDGTPADSVYVALYSEAVLPRAPDLVVSGINHGLNLGQDVFYSGTVAAAREGALHGHPALALSADPQADMKAACADACILARVILELNAGRGCLFNVNYPPGSRWEKCPTIAGRRHYSGGLVERHDPRGRPYYWIGGDSVENDAQPGTDTQAFDQGKVGITPLILNLSSLSLTPQSEAICQKLSL
jgi:5'-nucleotidase